MGEANRIDGQIPVPKLDLTDALTNALKHTVEAASCRDDGGDAAQHEALDAWVKQSDELMRALAKITLEIAQERRARKAGLDVGQSHKPRRSGIEGSGDGSPDHSFNKE
jgi:hypothetical protein